MHDLLLNCIILLLFVKHVNSELTDHAQSNTNLYMNLQSKSDPPHQKGVGSCDFKILGIRISRGG